MPLGLKVVLPSAVTDREMPKLEHYYGIEFLRGAADQGGANGYHKMIGDESLLQELRFHNQMKIASVKDAEIKGFLNQTNWNKNADGSASVLDGTDGCDIMQCHTKTLYAILGGTNSTYERFIISDRPFSYDGDVAKEYPAFAETPDFETVLNGVSRSIRNDGVLGTHLAGSGSNYTDPLFSTANAGGYPRTNLTRMQFEQYARAKNEDPNINVPYTNINALDLELIAGMMFIEFRTKDLRKCLGGGLSAYQAPTAATWGQVSGVRITTDNGATYEYWGFNKQLFLNGSASGLHMMAIITNSTPMLKVFEAQLAVSANPSQIESVVNSDGDAVQGVSDGVMTGIWTKQFSFNITAAFTNGGEAVPMRIEVVMRVPIWRGRTRLWGNMFQMYSGYDVINWKDADDKFHLDVYRTPSIEATDTTNYTASLADDTETFEFENKYDFVGSWPLLTGAGSIVPKNMLTHDGISLLMPADTGGGATTYESTTFYASPTVERGKKLHCRAPFGGIASENHCSLRYSNAPFTVMHAGPNSGSGFRVKLLV